MADLDASARFDQAKRHFLDGLDHFGHGRFDEAAQGFRASLALVPDRVSTLVNLAATQLKLAQADEALQTTARLLAQEPDNRDGHFHRGAALAQLGRHPEALTSLDRAVAIDPAQPELWLHHGHALQHVNRLEDALASYDRALHLAPDFAAAWTHRGSLLRDLHRLPEAAEAFRQALAHGADAELHRYYLASVGVEAMPGTAPSRYVRALFDDYAGQFDEHLVTVLRYRAPQVLAEHARTLHGGRYASALDLGCGTGLCGPRVKPFCARLTGVDLSGAMLDKARALGVYDRLVQADLVEHLRATVATADRHDLVLAADVFIYVGDLDPVFAALREAMAPEGVFAFSAEIASDAMEAPDAPGFELLPSLRYAHAARYLRAQAARHGFDVIELRRAPVREDQRRPVDGHFVWLQRRG